MSKILDKIESAIIHVDNFIERMTRFFWLLGGFCIVIMAFVVGYGAFTRYVFRSPATFTYGLTCILMLACVMFSIPYAQRLGKHLRLDLFDNKIPRAVNDVIKNLFSPLLGLVFCAVLTWKCWDTAIFALNISEMTKTDTPIPTFPLKLMITVFLGILCLVFILQILKELFIRRKRRIDNRLKKRIT